MQGTSGVRPLTTLYHSPLSYGSSPVDLMLNKFSGKTCVCACVCEFGETHTHIHSITHAQTHALVCVLCMCVCIYLCACVCTYKHTYICINFLKNKFLESNYLILNKSNNINAFKKT